MVLINLLPHREWRRKKQREAFFVQLGLAVGVSLLIALATYLIFQDWIANQEGRNRLLQEEIARLDIQIKEIATLQNELEDLKRRQSAVESLQADRNLSVHLLNELVRQLPEGVVLRSVKQDGSVIQLTGVAQSQERVSEFLRNLNGSSPWLQQPQLIEVSGTVVNLNPGGQRRVFNFSLRVLQVKAQPRAAASAASANL